MAPSSTISSKGQITVPIEVRRRLGVKPGDKLDFALIDGLTILRPALPETSPFEAYVGILPAFSSKEEINAWIREMRGDYFEEESQP